MSAKEIDNTVVLPCGHTAREHLYLHAIVKWVKLAFLVGIVIGGIVGIVSMLVFG